MHNRHVKFGPKIPNRLGKNVRKSQGGDFFLTHTVHVAFSNALRLLLKMPTWCSASQLFVQHGAISFLAVIRKQQCSLMRSLCSCNNAVIRAFVSSDHFGVPLC